MKEGDLQINKFMAEKELYRIYQKAKIDRDENDSFIQRSFSIALKKVQEKLSNLNSINDKMRHYIFVVPAEWEHRISDEIIRPMFKEAGLISDIDHPCRLFIYTKLDALVFGLQNESYALVEEHDDATTPVKANVVLYRGETLYVV
jgi:hypothetical protein